MATFSRMTFNKESDGRWYVDLPSYPGPKADLEMVAGADTFLDYLSKENEQKIKSVHLRISTDEPFGERLDLKEVCDPEEGGGAWYSYMGIVTMWLCNVMLFVFQHFPRTIYFDVLTPEENGD